MRRFIMRSQSISTFEFLDVPHLFMCTRSSVINFPLEFRLWNVFLSGSKGYRPRIFVSRDENHRDQEKPLGIDRKQTDSYCSHMHDFAVIDHQPRDNNKEPDNVGSVGPVREQVVQQNNCNEPQGVENIQEVPVAKATGVISTYQRKKPVSKTAGLRLRLPLQPRGELQGSVGEQEHEKQQPSVEQLSSDEACCDDVSDAIVGDGEKAADTELQHVEIVPELLSQQGPNSLLLIMQLSLQPTEAHQH